MIKKGLAFVIIILLISTTLASGINSEVDIQSSIILQQSSTIGDNHPPIYIDGNDNFTSENGVTSGDGTEGNPYIIENWIIFGNGSDGEGIFIINTDAFFVIHNCTVIGFFGATNKGWGTGIKFQNVKNGKIESSTTYENYHGIWIEKNSAYIEIVNCSSGNYSKNWSRAIKCDNSQHISIISSECHETDYGLILNETSFVVIKNSSFYNNYWKGIWGIGHHRGSIFNYTIKDCKTYNNAYGGISIHTWYEDPIIRHSGYLHIANCEIYDNGLPELNHVGSSGLTIGCLHDNIIENCTIYHNGMGINIIHSTNNIIRNCSIYNHGNYPGYFPHGIQIWTNGFTLGYKMKRSHNEIFNCDIFNNEIGIDLWRSKTIAKNNNVFNNSCAGIILDQFDRSRINYNNIYGNGFDELSDGSVLTMFNFVDLRYNWWGSSDGPEIGRYKDIYPVFSIARFRPWATEPIPDAGRQ